MATTVCEQILHECNLLVLSEINVEKLQAIYNTEHDCEFSELEKLWYDKIMADVQNAITAAVYGGMNKSAKDYLVDMPRRAPIYRADMLLW